MIDVGAVVGDAILLVFTCSLLVILDGRHMKKKKKSRRLKLDTKINVTQLLTVRFTRRFFPRKADVISYKTVWGLMGLSLISIEHDFSEKWGLFSTFSSN